MLGTIKWVHAPPHEAASHWLPTGYSLPTRPVVASRAFFHVGESLTLYEAARIISGRHPFPLDGAETLGPHIDLITAGLTGLTRRRHRPQRSKDAFEALRQKVMSGEVITIETPRLSHPGAITGGGIDWLNVKVKTVDVVNLCNDRGWAPRFLSELEQGSQSDSLTNRTKLDVETPTSGEGDCVEFTHVEADEAALSADCPSSPSSDILSPARKPLSQDDLVAALKKFDIDQKATGQASNHDMAYKFLRRDFDVKRETVRSVWKAEELGNRPGSRLL